MIEIIGENLEAYMQHFKIKATKTLSKSIGGWPNFEVWQMEDEECEKMCAITQEQFEEVGADGWWRGSDGSNLGTPNVCFKINNELIWAWANENIDDYWHEDYEKDEPLKQIGFLHYCRNHGRYAYKNLLEYMCEEWGVSSERNICALAVDLAKRNEITMAELFKKYM